METIGERLRQIRDEILRISREKCVEDLGISARTLERYENNLTSPPTSLINALWEKYSDMLTRENRDWLLTGEGEMLGTSAPGGDNKRIGHYVRDELRRQRSRREFARRSKISEEMLRRVEEGGEYDTGVLDAICNYKKITLDVLLREALGEERATSLISALPHSTVPVFGKVPPVEPKEPSDEVIEHISVPGLQSPSYAVIARGDSMTPTLKDGDYVFFVYTDQVESGDIVVANNEYGEAMIKRYRLKEGEEHLSSDNSDYKPITTGEHFRIVGKVVDVWRKIKI